MARVLLSHVVVGYDSQARTSGSETQTHMEYVLSQHNKCTCRLYCSVVGVYLGGGKKCIA